MFITAPTEITGCKLWLKADALSLSDGDPVSSWTDSSGQGNDADQATSGNRPTFQTNELNGKPVIRFDGTDDYLEVGTIAGLTSAITIVVVVVDSSGVDFGQRTVLGFGSPGDTWWLRRNGGIGFPPQMNVEAGYDLLEAPTIATGTYSTLIATGNGTTAKLYQNGVETGRTATASPYGTSGSFTIGYPVGNGYWLGDVAEVIIYDSELTDEQREAVEFYILRKYAVGNLPKRNALLGRLVSYWKLDEASGNATDSHGSYDLTDNSTVTSGDGKIETSRRFTAANSEYLSRADNVDLSTGGSAFSFSLWFKSASTPSYNVLLSKGSAGTGNREHVLYQDGGTSLTFEINSGSVTVAAPTAGAWNHVVCFYDPDNDRIGITLNGITTTAVHTAGGIDSSLPFELGASSTQSLYYDGFIDEVGFWKRCLNAEERAELYNYGDGLPYAGFTYGAKLWNLAKLAWTGGITRDMVSSWELNEASGDAIDAHGTNDLTDTNTVGSGSGLVYGTVRSFNGSNEYFTAVDNSSLSVSGNFTIELWVYFNTVTTGAGLLGKGGRPEYQFTIQSGTVEFLLLGNSSYMAVNTPTIYSGRWYQIIGWVDAGKVVGVTLNAGVPVTSGTSDTPYDGTGSLTIGAYFDGFIGPVRFWKRILNGSERAYLYNGGRGLTYSSFAFPIWGLKRGLVSYLALDEASGNAVDNRSKVFTDNGSVGTAAGVVGTSRDFDGSTQYLSHTSNLLNGLSTFSISCWVKFTRGSANWWPDTIFRSYDGGTTGSGVTLDLSGDGGGSKIRFTKLISYAPGMAEANSVIALNTWIHVVGTVSSGGKVTLYIDGVAQTTTATMSGTFSYTAPTWIGSTGGSSHWQGQIDELGIWSRELSPSEILELYNSGSGLAYSSFSARTRTLGTPATDVAGAKLALMANRLTLADADPVATWTDESGEGNDATQATSGSRPTFQTDEINGLPAIQFDGTDDWLDLGDLSADFPTAATLFVVVRLNSDVAYVVYDNGSADTWWRYSGDGDGYQGTFRSSRVDNYPVSMPTTGTYIFTVSSGAAYEIFINSLSQGVQAGGYAAGTSHRIGRGVTEYPIFLDGSLPELLIYDSALDSTDRSSRERYLSAKYLIGPSARLEDVYAASVWSYADRAESGGADTASPNAATVAAAGVQPSVTLGEYTATANAASVTVSAIQPSGDLVTSAAYPNVAVVAVVAVQGDVTGSYSASLDVASVAAAGIQPAYALGEVSASPGAAVSAVGASQVSVTGEVDAAPNSTTVAVTGSQGGGTGTGTAVAATNAAPVDVSAAQSAFSGAYTASSNSAVAAISGVSSAITLGGSTVSLNASVVAAAGIQATSSATYAAAVNTASIAISGVQVTGTASGAATATPEAATVIVGAARLGTSGAALALANTAVTSVSGVQPAYTFGVYSASPNTASVSSSGSQPSYVLGAVAPAPNAADAGVSATRAAFSGAVTLLPAAATVTTEAVSASLTLGEYVADTLVAAIAAAAFQVDIVLGGVAVDVLPSGVSVVATQVEVAASLATGYFTSAIYTDTFEGAF